MNETLILIVGRGPDEPIKWAFWSDGRIQLADIAENLDHLSELGQRASAAKMVALVLPGEDVAMRMMPSPPKGKAQFRNAARFLLEDELAENLDQVHFAIARHPSGAGLVLAVKKAILDEWIDELGNIGITPDIVTVDFALLPADQEQAVIVEANDRIVGSVSLQGFSLERPIADDIIETLLNDSAVSKIITYGSNAFALPEGVEQERRPALEGESLYATFAGALQQSGAVNFLQGAYKKTSNWRAAAKPWQRAAMLAAGLALSVFVLNIADAARSLRIADAYNREARAVHAAAFPDYANVNPRTHARQVLGSGSGSPMFTRLTNAVALGLEENENIQIDRIRYNALRNEYSLNLRFADINDLEVLKQSLAAQGISASEAGGVRRSGGIYLGELKVSAS
ncbi:type II secretion system protein GspL [Hyphococcus sp. DH-69]|uniref:type II secretion system protein GspL n=1 Tax=Hyphococcus formosus TaxID=3143534 RepID=UPI00398A9D43